MATIVAPTHRQHAFWLRVVEDIALVIACTAVAWMLYAVVVLRPASWRETLPLQGIVGGASPRESLPLPVVAASRPMMAAIAAATELEEHGEFGPQAAAAWEKAAAECRRLSVQPISRQGGVPLMLWLLEAEQERAGELAAVLASPGTPPDEVAALETLQAEATDNVALIQRYRDIVNFDHWRAVCEIGTTAAGREAHAAQWLADRATAAGRTAEAREAHEASFRAWRQVLDARPALLDDALVVEDIADRIGSYRKVLAGLDAPFPEAFVLRDVVVRAGGIAD